MATFSRLLGRFLHCIATVPAYGPDTEWGATAGTEIAQAELLRRVFLDAHLQDHVHLRAPAAPRSASEAVEPSHRSAAGARADVAMPPAVPDALL